MRSVPIHAVPTIVFALIASLVVVAPASAREGRTPLRPVEEPGPPPGRRGFTPQGAPIIVQTLGEWDFEDGLGGPDPQGWTIHDATTQEGTFFHVDDFAELGGGPYAPIRGSKSLWCGIRPGGCTYATPPGYGNDWDQRFDSVPFSTSGDVTVSFLIRYDLEAGYDEVRFDYLSISGAWNTAAYFDHVGESLASVTLPADSLSGEARLRFRVLSDYWYSDEDGLYNSNGAVMIDSLTVRDAGGVVDFQNFEAEAVDALTTLDGDWSAAAGPAYGLHAALIDGTPVVQEGAIVNSSHLWSFFSGSTSSYACGGFPAQATVPYVQDFSGRSVGIFNETRSPSVSLTQDIDGQPVTGPLYLVFDVYRDLPLEALVFYRFRVRSLVGGCWGAWKSTGLVYYGAQKAWFTHSAPLAALLEPGATQAQVALGVVDMCPAWCDLYGTGACHSHAPLFDNVRVVASHDIVVTNTNNSGAGSLRQAIVVANASPDVSGIAFDIPGTGPHTILLSTPLPSITTSVIIDGYTETGAVPNTNGLFEGSDARIQIELDGSSLASGNGLDIGADNCVVRGLVINGFPGAAISISASSSSRIEGCFLGTDATGMWSEPNEYGIELVGSVGTTVGGVGPAARNVISGNALDGVFVFEGSEHVVQANLIGVNAAGAGELGNGGGILIYNSTDNTVLSNVVSGNGGYGVLFEGGGGGTDLRRNYIGTDVSGTLPIGNSQHGVELNVSAGSGANVVIGGSVTSTNVIAFNAADGVHVALPTSGLRATISYNRIHSNGCGIAVTSGAATILFNRMGPNAGLGIDLAANGVTANDLNDVDAGPNMLQNYPILTAATPQPNGTIRISGSLNSTPSINHTVQFFRSPACDPSGNGEGEVFMGLASIVTDATGNRNFTINGFPNLPGGTMITSTANPTTQTGTSEFSPCFEYLNTVAGSNVTAIPVDETTGASPVTMTFDNVTSAGNALLEITDSGPPPPGGLNFGDNATYYDLTATASFTGSVEVCIEYDEAAIGVEESELLLLHYDTTLIPPAWVDITTNVDTVANVLCGTTTSLSPFAIAEPIQATGIGDLPGSPTEFALFPCAPNPFNPITTIRYDVPTNGAQVEIAVFDVTGRRVRTLVDRSQSSGRKSVTWDGRDDRGQGAASGVYFYRMSAGSFAQTRKMVLLK